jgi:hypothetical protein
VLRNWTAAIAVALAIAPIELSSLQIVPNDALAIATMKSTNLMPGKTKDFLSGSEYRVCNEGSAPVRMWSANSITNTSTDSLLEPGRCARCIGTMMSFTNESEVPVMLYTYGGMGGRPGRGPGPH